MLMQAERYADAHQELSAALSHEPDSCELHAMMAYCLLHLERKQEALKMAEKAVGLDPNDAYAFYVLALVELNLNRHKKAEQTVRKALALEPYYTHAWTLLGYVHSAQGRWKAVLEAADNGLAIDPDNAECHRLRAHALSFLGQADEAKHAVGKALIEDPDSPESHTHLGWIELRKGRHKEAMEHFKTALRLDPNQEYAREGLLDALRIRFPLYRWVYQGQMWIARFPPNAQWAIWIGLFIGVRLLRGVAADNPHLMPFIIPVAVAYGVFVWSTWIGEPLVNITLLMHPLGRLALPIRERRETWAIALFLALALFDGLGAWIFGLKLTAAAVVGVVFTVLLSLATRIHTAPKLRAGLFWGLTAFGGLLGVLMTLLPYVPRPK